MKEFRKIFLALITAAVVVFASAALPALADDGYTEDSGYTEDTGDTVPSPIAAQDRQPVTQQNAAPVQPAASNDSGSSTRSGVSFGTVFLMFILGIIINAGISFAIANRFRTMAKKDSHLQSEIRALRRDIDEKFTGSVKEIKEKAATVSNNNRNYSRAGGISYKEEKPLDEERAAEISKRWNIGVEEESEPEIKIRTSRRRNVKSTTERREPKAAKRIEEPKEPEFENLDADEGVSDSVKAKAKKFLGDIFPFDE